MSIPETLRRWAHEDQQVQDAAYRRNLQVLRVACWVVLALNLLHVLVFASLHFDDAVRSLWAHRIVVAHACMAVVMGVLGWVSSHLHGRRDAPAVLRLTPQLVSFLVLIWSVVLTLIDQTISPSINAYINAAVGVATVFLLRPRVALLLCVLGWGLLALAMSGMTQDEALLTTIRMNAASASVLAFLVNVLLWRRYVQAELLQRTLAATNRQLELQRAELETLATRDPLTGLLNRREFVRLAETEIARAQRQGGPLSMLMIDLDHFKSVNDRFGHLVGDEVLRKAGHLLMLVVRQTDRVARFGGEEFVVLLPDTSTDSALIVAGKLRQRLADTRFSGFSERVTASIGVASFVPGHVQSLDALIQQSDQALYEAKHAGRDRIVLAAAPTQPADPQA